MKESNAECGANAECGVRNAEYGNQIIKHPDMVRQLCKSGISIVKSMTPNDAHMMHMTIGISGEAGELLDAIKKAVIYREPLDLINVKEELGDLEFYMEGLRQATGITREECLEMNVAKLSTRYRAFKYIDVAAIDRVDKKVGEL